MDESDSSKDKTTDLNNSDSPEQQISSSQVIKSDEDEQELQSNNDNKSETTFEEENLESMIEYAWNLYDGNEVSADKIKALSYFEKSANQGDTESMIACAKIYYEGDDGIDIDKSKSAHYYSKAAYKGDVES